MFFNKDFIVGAAVGVAIATGAHYLYNRLCTRKDNDNDETTITKMEEDILSSDSKRQIIVADHAVSASATLSMSDMKMKLEQLRHLQSRSIELVYLTSSPYTNLCQIVNILIEANQVFKHPLYEPDHTFRNTGFENLLLCYIKYYLLWFGVSGHISNTSNTKCRKTVDALISFLSMEIASTQFSSIHSSQSVTYSQQVSIIKFQMVELLLERLSTLTLEQRHKLVTFLLETVSDHRAENKWLRQTIAFHFNCRLEGPGSSEEEERLTTLIRSIIDADHVRTFPVKDDFIISTSTKRDLVKIAKYAFDDNFEGLKVEKTRKKMKKVLMRLYGCNLDPSVMRAFVYEATNGCIKLIEWNWRSGRDKILEAYRKMVHLFKVALVDIGINPNAADQSGNTALHHLVTNIDMDEDIDKCNYMLEIIQLFIDSDCHIVHKQNWCGETIFKKLHHSIFKQLKNPVGPQRLCCLAAAAVPDQVIPLLNKEIKYPEKLINAIYHHQFSPVQHTDEVEDRETETDTDADED